MAEEVDNGWRTERFKVANLANIPDPAGGGNPRYKPFPNAAVTGMGRSAYMCGTNQPP